MGIIIRSGHTVPGVSSQAARSKASAVIRIKLAHVTAAIVIAIDLVEVLEIGAKAGLAVVALGHAKPTLAHTLRSVVHAICVVAGVPVLLRLLVVVRVGSGNATHHVVVAELVVRSGSQVAATDLISLLSNGQAVLSVAVVSVHHVGLVISEALIPNTVHAVLTPISLVLPTVG